MPARVRFSGQGHRGTHLSLLFAENRGGLAGKRRVIVRSGRRSVARRISGHRHHDGPARVLDRTAQDDQKPSHWIGRWRFGESVLSRYAQ